MTELDRKVAVYSTWLVLGVVEIGLGVERIVITWSTDTSLYGYVLGAVLTAAGVTITVLASRAARAQTLAIVRSIRTITAVLAMFVFGTPLLLVLVHGVAVVAGHADVNPTFSRSLLLLGLTGWGYVIGIPWANSRLRRTETKPTNSGPNGSGTLTS